MGTVQAITCNNKKLTHGEWRVKKSVYILRVFGRAIPLNQSPVQ